MKTACFNLVDERWLPVTLAEGFPDADQRGPLPRVSLREAFEHGDKIVDLRCYPHERIALMRLLICIAQRALDGPQDEDDWRDSRKRLATEPVHYLENKKCCFNLFGAGPRFLQAHGRGKPGEMTVSRLVFIDKDRSVLFDAHVQPERRMQPEELAVALVTYQSFAAGGKSGGSEPSPAGRKTKAGKIKNEPQSGEAALCRDGGAVHAFIVGATLSDTIHWNLVCRTQVVAPINWAASSKPVWECQQLELRNLLESNLEVDLLSRLAPLTRAVWLRDDLQKAEIANGLVYGVFADSKDKKTKRIKPGTSIREPTASIEADAGRNEQNRLVSASAGDGVPKALWRELHSIAVLRRSGNRGGPLAIEHLQGMPVQEAVLWCGALVGDQAKVGDLVESVFRLPVQFLEDTDTGPAHDPRRCPGTNQIYRKGVSIAEDRAGNLRGAVSTYHRRLADDFSKRQNSERGKTVQNQAAMRYWTMLEQHAEQVLLRDVAMNSGKYWSAEDNWMAKSPWGREVWKAAHDAYDFACPRSTPRQLRAYAAGLAALRDENRRKSTSTVKADDKNDSTEGEE